MTKTTTEPATTPAPVEVAATNPNPNSVSTNAVTTQNGISSFPPQLSGLEKCFTLPRKVFLAAGGTEEQFMREVNFAANALLANDYLISCAKAHPEHLIEAIKAVGLTGLSLNPELRLAYLVPYKGKIEFQSSYMGKADILIRTGIVKQIYAGLVYSHDTFEMVKGTNGYLKHVPDVFATDRGELKGGYFFAVLANGEKIFDAMPLSRINAIKARSQAVQKGRMTPWNTDFEEMARKTILNWAYKFLPKTGISQDALRALEVSSKYDNMVFSDWTEHAAQAPKRKDDFDEFTEISAESVVPADNNPAEATIAVENNTQEQEQQSEN